ncbi:MAG: dihydrofolate reductase [Oceanospirillaceae bacterium]|nr:dihydrofolate reductase [Oceanospirillaceae bacterium]
MTIALIVAASQNNVIGRNNQLPWHLPGDLQYFKTMTLGKPVIMGRKTFESIGKPLPGRDNIVISRQTNYAADGIKVVSSLEQAIALGQSINLINGIEEVMVIGGAQIYEKSLDLADRVYLTRVHRKVEGDAYFPALDSQLWHEIAREDIAAKEPNPFDFSYLVLERR